MECPLQKKTQDCRVKLGVIYRGDTLKRSAKTISNLEAIVGNFFDKPKELFFIALIVKPWSYYYYFLLDICKKQMDTQYLVQRGVPSESGRWHTWFTSLSSRFRGPCSAAAENRCKRSIFALSVFVFWRVKEAHGSPAETSISFSKSASSSYNRGKPLRQPFKVKASLIGCGTDAGGQPEERRHAKY